MNLSSTKFAYRPSPSYTPLLPGCQAPEVAQLATQFAGTSAHNQLTHFFFPLLLGNLPSIFLLRGFITPSNTFIPLAWPLPSMCPPKILSIMAPKRKDRVSKYILNFLVFSTKYTNMVCFVRVWISGWN